jgi:hypothetical protein
MSPVASSSDLCEASCSRSCKPASEDYSASNLHIISQLLDGTYVPTYQAVPIITLKIKKYERNNKKFQVLRCVTRIPVDVDAHLTCKLIGQKI